ncbi:MAG TPA: hypothetical protein VFS71_15740 [Flavobacterium sp.]|uniref:hypothetical protein n=1 Tax=Flavobacterium sp. TaxID=239 RepID=UPI002DB7FDE1|nr:hypothetical protein [Flavobacterium sp.]HEU4791139.1 hypothetical protein [Flavobacterium sp.]
MKKIIYTIGLCLVLTIQTNAQKTAPQTEKTVDELLIAIDSKKSANENDIEYLERVTENLRSKYYKLNDDEHKKVSHFIDITTSQAFNKIFIKLTDESDIKFIERVSKSDSRIFSYNDIQKIKDSVIVFGNKYFNANYGKVDGENYTKYQDRLIKRQREFGNTYGYNKIYYLFEEKISEIGKLVNIETAEFYQRQKDSITTAKENNFNLTHPNYENNCTKLKAKYIAIVNEGAKVGNALASIESKSSNISHDAFGQAFFNKTKVKGNDKIMYNSLVTKLKNLEASWMKLQNIEDNDTSLNKWMYIDAMVESDLVDVRTIMKSNAQNTQLIR